MLLYRPGTLAEVVVTTMALPDANHYMSARDIAALTREPLLDFPEHDARYSVRSFK